MTSTQFITDNKGKKVAVVLSMREYKRIMDELDEANCQMAYQKARKEKHQFVDARKFFQGLERKRKRASLRNNV